MNELTARLLEQLAAKLGVGIEVLWTALLRQAPIAAASNLLQYALLGVAWYGLWKWHCAMKNNDWDEFSWLPFGLAAITLVILTGAMLSFVHLTVAGFFNPEYWALQQLLAHK